LGWNPRVKIEDYIKSQLWYNKRGDINGISRYI
jgi:hypothetical protein